MPKEVDGYTEAQTPRGRGIPPAHWETPPVVSLTRAVRDEFSLLFLIGFIFHLLGKWNISWEVTRRDRRQVSKADDWPMSEAKVTTQKGSFPHQLRPACPLPAKSGTLQLKGSAEFSEGPPWILRSVAVG